MLTGLQHAHRGLAHLLILVALATVVLAISRKPDETRLAQALGALERFGVVGAGRLELVLGLALFFVMGLPWTSGWIWASVLLWGPVEVAHKRFVVPEIEMVRDGGQTSKRLLIGVGIELLCLGIIFGLMTARPF